MKTDDRKYAGAASRRFWLRVNRLPRPLSDKLYSLGIVLQDVEERVLASLRSAEAEVLPRKKGRGK